MGAVVEKGETGAEALATARRHSAIARAQSSERHFVWKLTLLLAIGVMVGWLGIWRVKQRSAGVRTAYELATLHDQLREQVELNRRHAATLAGKKDPNRLRDEAEGVLQMRAPGPREQVELD